MRRVFRKLRSWWRLRRCSQAMRKAHQWSEESERLSRRIEKSIKRLKKLRTLFEVTADDTLEDVEEALRLQRKHEHALEGLREENTVMSQITIPFLTAAHKSVLERVEAETAIQIRKKVTNTPFRQEE